MCHVGEKAQLGFIEPDLSLLQFLLGIAIAQPGSIEILLGIRFQVARCVYYQDGSEGMGFHTDLPAYESQTDWIPSNLSSEL